MTEFLLSIHPIWLALMGTLLTWGLTAIGAAAVFTTKRANQKLFDGMLAFAGGVMIAASFWSLLDPGIQMAKAQGVPPYIPAAIGFLLGGAFLLLVDWILPMIDERSYFKEIQEPKAKRRTAMLVFSITLHNIPEGLAIGVAFGSLIVNPSPILLYSAIALSIGIGIQNLPEGMAVSIPLRREGMSVGKSFFWGQFSGMVEPISAVIGVVAVMLVQPLLPYALSFAAGAMIFVVAKEIIPASVENGHTRLATMSLMIGFTVMMILDVALG